MQVLTWLLGPRLQAVHSGASLLDKLQRWESSSVSAAVVAEIESYVEEHASEFCEGAHLGGPCENAVYMWADAALSLVSV